MKQILYIPTGELVTFYDLNAVDEQIYAGEYVDSGQFKEEFSRFNFWNDSIDPFQLIIKFIIGEIKDGEDLVFGDHIYEHLKISVDTLGSLLSSEFEIIDS